MGEEEDNEPPRRPSSSPPPTPTLKTDPEDELLKDHKEENHSEEETKQQIQDEDDEDDEEEEEDRPLLDMMAVDFPPPSSTLPPTPPLPSSPSPTDLDTEQLDSDEDDGPPPGWDHFQLNEQQVVTPAATVSLDKQTEDVRRGEEGELQLHGHHCLPPEEVAPLVEEQDSEDDGPPPGWDSKCQPESKTQETTQSDMKMEDVLPDIQTEEGQPTPEVPSVDSEDEGPPPGWDSKCQPEPKSQNTPQSDLSDIKTNYVHEDAQNDNGLQSQSQSRSSPATQLVPSDMKMEDVQQDAHNKEGQPRPEVPSVDPEVSEDEGPPPGWDSKCQPEPKLETTPQSDSSDTKTNNVHENAQNENGFQLQSQSQSQSQSRSSPAPEPVSSDINVEEQDLEDDGPPPGWNSKSELEPSLQMTCPTTPPSGFKIEEDKEVAIDKEVSSTGLGSTPQQQPHVPSSLPTPTIQPGTSYESNNAKNIEGSPQQFTRQRLIHPTKPQIYAPKPPMPINNYPEMGQMVCGSCRHLLSYPRGARYVECACCLEKNYVLEEHEVGQVICGGCKVLLMYPHGAPKVRCANCRTETEVGDQNRRPSLSEHKRRGRQHLKRVHAG